VTTKDAKGVETSHRIWSDKGAFFFGALPTDFNSTACPLLNGVSVKFVFTLTPQNIFLLTQEANEDVKFVLTYAAIHIPVGELSDEMALRINHRLKSEPALINYRRRQVLPFTIPANSKLFVSDSLFVETAKPCRVIFAFVTEDSYLGMRSLNSFNFRREFGTVAKPCKVVSLSLTVNGSHLDGLDCAEEQEMNYMRMFLFNEQRNTGTTNGVTFEAFNDGYFFIVYDLTASLSSSSVLSNPLVRDGQYRARVEFSSNTPNNIVCLAYTGKYIR
jgi:hypothetical protein